MRKAIFLVLSVLFLSGCAGWSQPFDEKEWVLAGFDTLFHAADYSTTQQLMDVGYTEYNPIIADLDESGVATYFVSTWVLKMAVAKSLPHKQRKWWLGAGIFGGATCTINNLQLDGVGLWE